MKPIKELLLWTNISDASHNGPWETSLLRIIMNKTLIHIKVGKIMGI